MKLMRIVAVCLAALITQQTLAGLAPSQFWMLDGLRFKLQTIASTPASPTPAETTKSKKEPERAAVGSKKRPLIPDLLTNGSQLAPESPERKALDELGIPVGDAPSVNDWGKGFSPLVGMLAWRNSMVHNLYFYGPKNDPLDNLVIFVFHAAEDSHELSVTYPRGGGSKQALRTLVELPIFGTVVRGALAQPTEKITDKVKELINKDLNARLASELAHISDPEIRRQIPNLIISLSEAITNAKKSEIFPPYVIGIVLSAAWYWGAKSTLLIPELKDAAVVRLGEPDKELKNLFEGAADPLSYMTSAHATDETKAIAACASLQNIPYPPYVPQGWSMPCEGHGTYPDCGENTLHNLFDFLLFDPKNKKEYQPAYLKLEGLNPQEKLLAFYKTYAAVDSSLQMEVRREWNAIVSGIPDVPYGLANKCDISPTPEAMLKVIRYLLGLSESQASTWAHVGKLLSTPTRTVQFEGEQSPITVSITEKGSARRMGLKMSAQHAEAHFPSAETMIATTIKEQIKSPIVRLLLNFDELSKDIRQASLQAYVGPFDTMDIFDFNIARLLTNGIRDPLAQKYTRHWFESAMTKWLEMPDGAPWRIIDFAWSQIRTDGPFKKEALQFVSKALQKVKKAYINTLMTNAAGGYDSFQSNFKEIVAAADNQEDLLPIFLYFFATGSDEVAKNEGKKIEAFLTEKPALFLDLVPQINVLLLQSALFENRLVLLLDKIIGKIPISPALIDFFANHAHLYSSSLRDFSTRWIENNIFDKPVTETDITPMLMDLCLEIASIKDHPLHKKATDFLTKHFDELAKLLREGKEGYLFYNLGQFLISPQTDAAEQALAQNVLDEISKLKATANSLSLILKIAGKNAALREKALESIAAHAADLREFVQANALQVFDLFTDAPTKQSAIAAQQKIFDTIIRSLKPTPALVEMCIGIVQKNAALREKALEWLDANSAAIGILVQQKAIELVNLRETLVGLEAETVGAATVQRLFDVIIKALKPMPALASDLCLGILYRKPSWYKIALDWLAANSEIFAQAVQEGEVNVFSASDILIEDLKTDTAAVQKIFNHIIEREAAPTIIKLCIEIALKNTALSAQAITYLAAHADALTKTIKEGSVYSSQVNKLLDAALKNDAASAQKIFDAIASQATTPEIVPICFQAARNKAPLQTKAIACLAANAQAFAEAFKTGSFAHWDVKDVLSTALKIDAGAAQKMLEAIIKLEAKPIAAYLFFSLAQQKNPLQAAALHWLAENAQYITTNKASFLKEVFEGFCNKFEETDATRGDRQKFFEEVIIPLEIQSANCPRIVAWYFDAAAHEGPKRDDALGWLEAHSQEVAQAATKGQLEPKALAYFLASAKTDSEKVIAQEILDEYAKSEITAMLVGLYAGVALLNPALSSYAYNWFAKNAEQIARKLESAEIKSDDLRGFFLNPRKTDAEKTTLRRTLAQILKHGVKPEIVQLAADVAKGVDIAISKLAEQWIARNIIAIDDLVKQGKVKGFPLRPMVKAEFVP